MTKKFKGVHDQKMLLNILIWLFPYEITGENFTILHANILRNAVEYTGTALDIIKNFVIFKNWNKYLVSLVFQF